MVSRTYIVVAIFGQECDPLTSQRLPVDQSSQIVLGRGDIVKQAAIAKGAVGRAVDDGRTLRVVFGNGFENGHRRQGGSHSETRHLERRLTSKRTGRAAPSS